MNTCGNCKKVTTNAENLKCGVCFQVYHHTCTALTTTNFKKMSRDAKALWKCSACKKIAPKRSGGKSDSPCQDSQGGASSAEDSSALSTTPTTSPAGNSRDDFRAALREELPSILREIIAAEMAPLRDEISALKISVQFANTKYDEMKLLLDKRDSEVKELLTATSSLEKQLHDMTIRMVNLEQYSRESNIEIHGLPEFKNEDLPRTILKISEVVSANIEDCDILSCFRVAKLNRATNKPRSVIVKLRSTRCRDVILTAITKYNKGNPKEKLDSHAIGIGGESARVYVSEHLSPEKKSLHAATRIKCKEVGYKYVWIRNGQILIRKSDQEKAIRISSQGQLNGLRL
ncbi:unnamed protein product [Leptosia nina]|uniref:FP protein C-terminal domain-containing protein n=1 Tax=Leptosia nina TaxID=320188 RepID=A0AAV1JP35_9NEOP